MTFVKSIFYKPKNGIYKALRPCISFELCEKNQQNNDKNRKYRLYVMDISTTSL